MGMKAVGLLSGGKDSVFAMHCAYDLGHVICAVATLLPRDGHVETDSYMYQSVGTAMTAAIAECLGVPCFSANVKGQSIATETLNYETTAGDEVEDLHALLLQVKEAIPGLQAVTCGAILSEFQRRRLEQVCQRLGLVPICLMWNRQQEALLHEMINWGLHAVLVKTASMGLTQKHVGRSISELMPHFLYLNKNYDFHVCGEGGEYETLTLDCPLFEKGLIVVSEWQEICKSEDPFAPVWLLSPTKWTVQQKQMSNDAVALADTAKLHSIELRRFQPYEDLIRTAVEKWSSAYKAVDIPPGILSAGEYLPDDSGDWNKGRRWNVEVHSTSTGCFLTADVSVCSEDTEEGDCYYSWPPTEVEPYDLALELQEPILHTAGQWLDMQLQGNSSGENEGKAATLVQTICQVCHLGMVPVVEELFTSRSVEPHPITFIVTSLPRAIVIRFRMVVGYSSNFSVSTGCVWKSPPDQAILHVHSLNWWVPPCPWGKVHGEELNSFRRKCRNCQAVRCEPISDGSTSLANVFLRGCDGRFPHSGLLPDPASNDFLQGLAGKSHNDTSSQQALDVVLQSIGAFLNVQQVLRLSQAGAASRGFSDVPYEYHAEPENLLQGFVGPEVHFPRLPLCILAFVKLGDGDTNVCMTAKGKVEYFPKLTAVKELVEGIVAQSCEHTTSLAREQRTEVPCIVIAAEVSTLPGDGKVLMLPLWAIADQQGTMANAAFVLSSTEQIESQGVWWKETVTALTRRRGSLPNSQSRLLEEDSRSGSVLVHISFGDPDCNCKKTSPRFLEQFSRAVARELEKHFVQEAAVHRGNCHGTGGMASTQVKKQVLEVFVFYSCARLLMVDEQIFEALCLAWVIQACEKMFAELPVVTFFPVRILSRGFVEVLICSIA